MLYRDFLEGTGAQESRETLDQFRVMQKIYTDCPSVSQNEIFRLWKKTYGKEMKERHRRMMDRADSLLMTTDDFQYLPEIDQIRVREELAKMFWLAYHNFDGSSNGKFRSGRTYTDDFGIAWGLKQVGSSTNGCIVYGLFAVVDGICRNAHFRV